jgi:hypothetical protein
MVMNSKGQVLFYTLMLSVIILVLALAFAPIIKQFITTAMSDLNCSDSSISDWDKATCYGLDILFWLFVCFFIVIAFVVINAKVAS